VSPIVEKLAVWVKEKGKAGGLFGPSRRRPQGLWWIYHFSKIRLKACLRCNPNHFPDFSVRREKQRNLRKNDGLSPDHSLTHYN
jgi:hypothetical protein